MSDSSRLVNAADVGLGFAIGMVTGGTYPSEANVEEYLRLVLRYSARLWGERTWQCLVNVVFHVPGVHVEPDFTGIRSGRFSRKDRIVMMQVAVPSSFSSEAALHEFVFDSLADAGRRALRFFSEEGLDCGSMDTPDEAVGRLRRELSDIT